jgi:hypothetical protein
MALGAPQSMGYVGTNITLAAVGAFEFVSGSSRRFALIRNGSGGATTVQVQVPGQTFEQNNPDVSVNVPAGEDRLIGPLDTGLADPTSGLITVVTSPTTSITGAIVDLPTPPPDLP